MDIIIKFIVQNQGNHLQLNKSWFLEISNNETTNSTGDSGGINAGGTSNTTLIVGIAVPIALLVIALISYSLYVNTKYKQPCLRAAVIVMCCECDKISDLSSKAKIEDQAM